jgi:hypothetical protein
MVRLTLPVRKALTSSATARDRAARALPLRELRDGRSPRLVLASIALACAGLTAALEAMTAPQQGPPPASGTMPADAAQANANTATSSTAAGHAIAPADKAAPDTTTPAGTVNGTAPTAGTSATTNPNLPIGIARAEA